MTDRARGRDLLERLEESRKQLATYRVNLRGGADDSQVRALGALTERLQRWLRQSPSRVVLIGPPGVGKSSVLVALTKLYLGDPPRTVQEQLQRSLLPVGSGRSTTFPITLRLEGPTDQLRLEVEEMDEEERSLLVEDVARAELLARSPHDSRGDSERPDPLGEELRRAVLNAANYGERLEKSFEGNLLRVRRVRPLDELLANRSMEIESLRDHLLERLGKGGRTEWSFDNDDRGRKQLQGLLQRINLGEEPEAQLPRRLVVELPRTEAAGLELIDTRGLDTTVTGRSDLHALLRDPTVVPLLFSTFPNAPCPELTGLLQVMNADPALRGAAQRAVLLIVDKGESAAVVDVGGDPELGQATRAEDAWRALDQSRLTHGLGRERVLVLDPLRDDPRRLMEALLAASRRAEDQLLDQAEQVVAQVSAILQSEPAGAQLDEDLAEALRGHWPSHEPLEEPLAGLLMVIEACPYWLRIVASFRREGDYEHLNLRQALAQYAAQQADLWCQPVREALLNRLDELRTSQTYAAGLLDARRMTLLLALDDATEAYGKAVREEVFRKLKGAELWRELQKVTGSGARKRALEQLSRWSKASGLTAHREVPLATYLPLIRRVLQPEAAPSFTLRARNFRRLRDVCWELSSVNLLIGANGSGKSTLLLALRFFTLALERGADQAIAHLGSMEHVRSWGSPETEGTELALEKDGTRWSFTLSPRSSESTPVWTEALTHRGERLLFVDAAGRLSYREQDLEPIRGETGLATLLRLNKADLPLRRMATLARALRSHAVPNLHKIKAGGTRPLPERPLETDGGNALAVLMHLRNAPGKRSRYLFVLESLKLAFPELIEDLSFRATEAHVEAYVKAPDWPVELYLGYQADGLVQFLVQMVAVATAEEGGVIALDQPEDGLHPYAIKILLSQLEDFAREHHLTLILATHSLVLLNALNHRPERVFVMRPGPDGTAPAAMSRLYDETWLQGFALGDFYANGNASSNDDPLE